jgi:hypothetical protein
MSEGVGLESTPEPRGTDLRHWTGLGLTGAACNGGGLGWRKVTSGGADGWSPTVEIESRSDCGPCGSSHVAGGGQSTAVDGELLEERATTSEVGCPTTVVVGSGEEGVLDEEEMTAVLSVSSDDGRA